MCTDELYTGISSIWLQKSADPIICDPIKRQSLYDNFACKIAQENSYLS